MACDPGPESSFRAKPYRYWDPSRGIRRIAPQTILTVRPFRRLLLSILRPLRVRIRVRKPLLRNLLILLLRWFCKIFILPRSLKVLVPVCLSSLYLERFQNTTPPSLSGKAVHSTVQQTHTDCFSYWQRVRTVLVDRQRQNNVLDSY